MKSKSIKNPFKKQQKASCNFGWVFGGSWTGFWSIWGPSWDPSWSQVETQVGAKMHQKSMKVLVEFVVGFWKGSGVAKLIPRTKGPTVPGPRGGVRAEIYRGA